MIREYNYEMHLIYVSGRQMKVVYLTHEELIVAAAKAEHDTAIDVVKQVVTSHLIKQHESVANLFNQPQNNES